jgi:hypothetical protein
MFRAREHIGRHSVVAGVTAVGLIIAALPETAVAGVFEDGVAAYQHGDYVTAVQVLRPLAEMGNDTPPR